jgi:type II restriction/modification system DNA methylase subunit YeeA
MNTSNIKRIAPQARRSFINAVMKRLNELGIYSDSQIAESSQQGELLNIEGRHYDIKIRLLRDRLVAKVNKLGFLPLVENVAYTWFNRLCAIRYMELHDYLDHGFRVLSHPNNPKTFEILEHAQDIAEELGLNRNQIIELKLAGNKDEQLYRELLIGQCHQLHKAMPFLFEALDDETELLLPDNLTRTDSILRSLVDDIPEEDWQEVEVIGWLYQFYISEKKDQVIGKVVKSEDIPAATQLFTPNWIVKYLVQNSVGRQWLQTYPDSEIKSEMEYYIEPAEQTDEVNAQLKSITPDSIDPETIKVLDPACGSGHILVEAYKVLKAIYKERGFKSRDIPKLILENNLFGLDIDDRAAQLSGFALMMLARNDDRRIFTRNVKINVLSLQESSHLDLPVLWRALNLKGDWQKGMSQGLLEDDQTDLGSAEADSRYQLLKRTLDRFEQAKTFGSLIDVPVEELDGLYDLINQFEQLSDTGDTMQKPVSNQLLPIVKQSLILALRYDAVVANPPYMGGKGMNIKLKKFAKDNYPCSKSDLFAIFIERGFLWLKETGFNSMVTMQSWMFLSSYERMRENILDNYTIENMVHMGNGVMKIAFGTNATIFRNLHMGCYKGFYSYVENSDVKEDGEPYQFPIMNDRLTTVEAYNFKKIPGSPIAYWVSEKFINTFHDIPSLSSAAKTLAGMQTGDNDLLTRYWFEVEAINTAFNCESREDAINSGCKWFPYNKGGYFKKWFGNQDYVVNWENDGEFLKQKKSRDLANGKITANNSKCWNQNNYFTKGITWSKVSSGIPAFRYQSFGSIFDIAGVTLFPFDDDDIPLLLGVLNSNYSQYALKMLSPTLNFETSTVAKVPILTDDNYFRQSISGHVRNLLEISKLDYSQKEDTRYFLQSPLITKVGISKLQEIVKTYVEISINIAGNVKKIEESINVLVINAYGLDSEFKCEVPIEQISLNCNPYFKSKKNETAAIESFISQVVVDFLSYSIGCMMGRYSLDQKGLVYANSGNEGFSELEQQGIYKTFPVDDDGIIPITDQEWFADDATNSFREFVGVVWGEDDLQQNLDFVAECLCLYAIKAKNSESSLDTIRRYLSTKFYKEHLKTYKKRPIYWLFSSGKQKAFECLVYLHRYNEGTLARIRTEYVTPLLGKYDIYAYQLQKQLDDASSTTEANRFKNEIRVLQKKQSELREFDDKLKYYADMQISLDLDDGVKVNYGKFDDLLGDVKAIHGKLAS